MVVSSPREDRSSSVLGPDSVLWSYLGDWRLYMVLGRGLLLQVCHPTIGAGVAEHSYVRSDPWHRLRTSLTPIVECVYARDGAEIGTRIRAAHRDIGGVDHQGRRYHAFEPEAYWWVLATTIDSVIVMSQLYFDRLENHPTAHDVLAVLAEAPPPSWWPAPARTGSVFTTLTGPVMTTATVGTLPEPVREQLGLSWTAGDQRRLDALARGVRLAARPLPRQARYMPVARRAWADAL